MKVEAILGETDGEHSDEVMALQKKVAALQKKLATFRKQTCEQLGKGRDLYNKIVDGGKLSPTDNEQYLIEYYSIFHYETYDSWMKNYKDLSTRLITYLILTDMGKSNAEIEETLSITKSTVRSIRLRLKAKLEKRL